MPILVKEKNKGVFVSDIYRSGLFINALGLKQNEKLKATYDKKDTTIDSMIFYDNAAGLNLVDSLTLTEMKSIDVNGDGF